MSTASRTEVDTRAMASVSITGLSKVFPDGTAALRDFNLEIDEGELIVFVGPSGCGKTTALRIVAGLEEATSGEVRIDGRSMAAVSAQHRDVAMVFQSYALYPFKSVYDNIAFPLKLRGASKAEISQRVHETARLLDLEHCLNRKPRQLSGGQRQRVAMGRAIVRRPQVFLMDEPLSNLDAKLRTQMRAEIAQLQERLGTTTVYVTHDQVEAMTLGDRVVVMRDGELQQVATPDVLYEHPANLFVAGFIGSPPMNFAQARLTDVDGELRVSFGSNTIVLDDEERVRALRGASPGGEVILGVRPEQLEPATEADAGRTLDVEVLLSESLGAEVIAHCELDAAPVVTDDVRALARDVDDTVAQDLDRLREQARTKLIARLHPKIRPRKGEALRLRVSPGGLAFFDAERHTAL